MEEWSKRRSIKENREENRKRRDVAKDDNEDKSDERIWRDKIHRYRRCERIERIGGINEGVLKRIIASEFRDPNPNRCQFPTIWDEGSGDVILFEGL